MFLTAGLIVAGAWICLLILVLALCAASSRADAAADRAYHRGEALEV